MSCDPLAKDRSLIQLKEWMDRAGVKTLWDISQWENNNWQRWRNLEVPSHLSNEYATLLIHLKGKAPLNTRKEDTRGWGSVPGNYTVSQGYNHLPQKPNVPPDPKPWQGIWSQSTFPKIDIFC